MKFLTKHSLLKPLSFVPAILMMSLIFSFSSQTGTESGSLSHEISVTLIKMWDTLSDSKMTPAEVETHAGEIEFYVRKLAHMTEYAILALTVSLPLYVYGMRGKRLALVTFFFCAAFAAGDEYHQSFVDGRGPSVRDVVIDSTGVLAGTGLFQLFCFLSGRKNARH